MRIACLLSLIGLLMNAATFAPADDRADHALSAVPFTKVKFRDQFWAPRIETNRKVTIWYDFKKCEETGRIDNFAIAGGLKTGGFQGIFYNDSDVVKVIEGASYSLAVQADPKLEKYLDDLIAKIAAAQEDDGYLYTARTINDPKYKYPGKEARWSHLAHGHELYNVGHLYEAAVAHHQATGNRSLLDVAIKNADLVCETFGPGEGQRVDVPGHEEIEIGLVKLYRVTADEKYLRQAKFFIDMRGRSDKRETYGPYCQDHVPLVQQTEAVGHAVRAGYLYAGVADVAAITGDGGYITAIDSIWNDVVRRKLYLIGSVGQHGSGEGFAGPYKLTNLKAYNETCAAIALALWNHRMFLRQGDGKYVDVLERILYNGFLSGVSLSGDRFFYPNPLACDMRFKFNHGSLQRSPWFNTSCCPVNVVRFLPSIPGYVVASREDAIYVNLYVGSESQITLDDQTVTLSQRTSYPWDGEVTVTVEPERTGRFELRLRIPGWARGNPLPSDLYRYLDSSSPPYRLELNGTAVETEIDKGYAVLDRQWSPGDTVVLDLPMPVRRTLCHENVSYNRGRVAIERGPIVYCIEGADHDGKVMNLFLPDDVTLTVKHRADLLGGVSVLGGQAQGVYRADDGSVRSKEFPLTMIPYYAWCNRLPNEMQVWIPRDQDGASVPPLPTIASTSKVVFSYCHPADDGAALKDQMEPQSSIDHEIPRFTWWDHKGTTEWVQYEFVEPTKVASVDVYWFDDTGRGQCRVPESWKLQYRDGETWKGVKQASEYGTARDKYNRVTFEPIETTALRIEVQLKPDFSGGILEWKVR